MLRYFRPTVNGCSVLAAKCARSAYVCKGRYLRTADFGLSKMLQEASKVRSGEAALRRRKSALSPN